MKGQDDVEQSDADEAKGGQGPKAALRVPVVRAHRRRWQAEAVRQELSHQSRGRAVPNRQAARTGQRRASRPGKRHDLEAADGRLPQSQGPEHPTGHNGIVPAHDPAAVGLLWVGQGCRHDHPARRGSVRGPAASPPDQRPAGTEHVGTIADDYPLPVNLQAGCPLADGDRESLHRVRAPQDPDPQVAPHPPCRIPQAPGGGPGPSLAVPVCSALHDRRADRGSLLVDVGGHRL